MEKNGKEEVLREFPPVGKYRIRLMKDRTNPSVHPVLDIREYVVSETFEGYTRRGIRLTNRAQIDVLKDTLKEVQGAIVI